MVACMGMMLRWLLPQMQQMLLCRPQPNIAQMLLAHQKIWLQLCKNLKNTSNRQSCSATMRSELCLNQQDVHTAVHVQLGAM